MTEVTIDNNIFATPEAFRAELNKAGNESLQVQVESPEVKNEPEVTENPVVSPEPEEKPVEVAENVEPQSEQALENTEQPAKESKYIPKARFNQEITKRKEAEDLLQREREEKIRYQTQLEMFQKLQNQTLPQNTPAPAPKLPDLNEIDALDKETHQVVSRKISEIERKTEETNRLTQQMMYTNFVNAQIQTFEKQQPDYLQAVDHIKGVFRQDIEDTTNFDPRMSKEEKENIINQGILNRLGNMGINAINSGKNAAEVMYKTASRYGYKPQSGNQAPSEVKKESKGPNLEAINQNMKKTASIQNIGNNIAIAPSKVIDIKSALIDPENPKSGIDPAKFHQLIKKAS